jgi:hypothetical protein
MFDFRNRGQSGFFEFKSKYQVLFLKRRNSETRIIRLFSRGFRNMGK